MTKNSHKKGLILKKPEIIDLSKDRTRLSCDIYDNDKLKTLYFEVEKKYKQYLCYERSDAFIISILPYTMLSGQDIYCETPVTETLLHNINEILVPNLAAGHETKYKLMKIHADTDNTPIKGTEVSTGHSLGVDSFYTISKTINSSYNDLKLTHLLNIRRPHAEKSFSKHYQTLEEAAASLKLPTTFIITNVRTLWKSLHGSTHIYTNMGAAYALRKLINTYYYSTAYDLNKFSIAKGNRTNDRSLLLLAHSFTTPDFNVLMGGTPANRHAKIMRIYDCKIVQKNLRVCVTSPFNCSECWKCKRSIMEFDMLGVLDNYREVFDVEYYLDNKVEYFKELYLKPDNALIKPLYEHFIQKEPELCAQAEKLFSKDVKNLSDEDFKAKYLIKKNNDHYKYFNKVEKIKKSMPKPIKKVLKKIIIRK
jgi:hypothetical protein